MFKSLRLQNFCSLLPSQSLPLGPKKAKSCLQRNHSGFLHLTGKTPENIELCNFRLGPENSLVSSFLSTLVCRKYQNGYTFKKTLVQSPPSASTCLNPERGYFLLFFFFSSLTLSLKLHPGVCTMETYGQCSLNIPVLRSTASASAPCVFPKPSAPAGFMGEIPAATLSNTVTLRAYFNIISRTTRKHEKGSRNSIHFDY